MQRVNPLGCRINNGLRDGVKVATGADAGGPVSVTGFLCLLRKLLRLAVRASCRFCGHASADDVEIARIHCGACSGTGKAASGNPASEERCHCAERFDAGCDASTDDVASKASAAGSLKRRVEFRLSLNELLQLLFVALNALIQNAKVDRCGSQPFCKFFRQPGKQSLPDFVGIGRFFQRLTNAVGDQSHPTIFFEVSGLPLKVECLSLELIRHHRCAITGVRLLTKHGWLLICKTVGLLSEPCCFLIQTHRFVLRLFIGGVWNGNFLCRKRRR